MIALQIIAAWCALSVVTGLLLGRAIPPTHHHAHQQRGEGERGGVGGQTHFGSFTRNPEQDHG